MSCGCRESKHSSNIVGITKKNTINYRTCTNINPDIITKLKDKVICEFQKLLKSGEPLPADVLLSVRQLMQYVGTEVLRRFVGDKIWINF